MNIFQFIAALAQSLAWPVVAIAAIIAFKGEISGLIASIRKISGKGFELDIDRATRETARRVESAQVEAKLPTEAIKQIEAKPRAPENVGRIIIAWTELMEMVRQRLTRAGLDTDGSPDLMLIGRAEKNGILTNDQSRSLQGLLALRNLAAHGRGETDISRTEDFLTMAEAIKTVLTITDGKLQG